MFLPVFCNMADASSFQRLIKSALCFGFSNSGELICKEALDMGQKSSFTVFDLNALSYYYFNLCSLAYERDFYLREPLVNIIKFITNSALYYPA